MIHTVYIDDSTVNGRRMLEEMQENNEGIEFEENNISGVAEPGVQYFKSEEKIMKNSPSEYMTSDEFWQEADKKISKICKDHGVL